MVNYPKADDGLKVDSARPCEMESNMSLSSSIDVSYPRLSLSRAALVCGFLSLFLGFLIAVPGIIIGHTARSQIRDNPYRFGGDKLALTGLMLSYLAGALSLMTIVYVFAYPETLQTVAEYTGYSLILSER